MEIKCHEISDFAIEIEDYINHIKPNLWGFNHENLWFKHRVWRFKHKTIMVNLFWQNNPSGACKYSSVRFRLLYGFLNLKKPRIQPWKNCTFWPPNGLKLLKRSWFTPNFSATHLFIDVMEAVEKIHHISGPNSMDKSIIWSLIKGIDHD